MRDHHQVVALPGHRYQVVVGDQQVDDLVRIPASVLSSPAVKSATSHCELLLKPRFNLVPGWGERACQN